MKITRRISKFFHQLFFRVPIAALINFIVAFPIFIFYAYFIEKLMGDTMINAFYMIPVSLGIMVGGFRLNKWRYNRKGKQTDQYFQQEYEEIRYKTSAEYDNLTEKIEIDTYETGRNRYTMTYSQTTSWGSLASLTSFIALPLQLVALAMSFLGIFIPIIYTSTKAIPYNLGSFNKMTHILFDFIIIIK